MERILFLSIILITLSLVYATYTTNIDSADCILYAKYHYTPIPEYYAYNLRFTFGDFDNDGVEDMLLLQFYTADMMSPGAEKISIVRILWGDSIIAKDSIIVDNYNTLIFNNHNGTAVVAFEVFDMDSDGIDDILFAISSIFPDDTAKLYIYLGRRRSLWKLTDTLYYERGVLYGPTRCHFESNFHELLTGNFDDDTGRELVEMSINCPVCYHCALYGHFSIFDLEDIPLDTIMYAESLYFCIVYGNASDPGPDLHEFGLYTKILSNLGDLNADGIDEFAISAKMTRMPYYCIDTTCPFPAVGNFYFSKNYIFWGRRKSSWLNIGVDSIINVGHDSLLSLIFTKRNGMLAGGDINGDGINDLLISDYSVIILYYDYDSWLTENDTSKLYILYGGTSIDSIKGKSYNYGNLGELLVKSRYACDGTGNDIATGDFNGDGFDDIAVTSLNKQDPGIIYLITGNPSGNFPPFFQQAQLKIIANDTLNYGDTTLSGMRSLLPVNDLKFVDINRDGLDDLIFTIWYRCEIDLPDKDSLIPIGYIFINKRPEIAHIYPSDTTLRPGDILAFKIAHKFPIAKGSVRLSINADTFDISAPELIYFPPASLLIFSPPIPWDSTKGYWICIQNITDTIGTPPDSLPLCFGFNGATTAVYEPPKPRTLSLTCYPNPFNAETRIKLRMPDAGDVKIDIYDISGKLIDHIYKTKLTAGWHELFWRPNVSVPSGVYLLRVSAGSEAVVRRVVLVR